MSNTSTKRPRKPSRPIPPAPPAFFVPKSPPPAPLTLAYLYKALPDLPPPSAVSWNNRNSITALPKLRVNGEGFEDKTKEMHRQMSMDDAWQAAYDKKEIGKGEAVLDKALSNTGTAFMKVNEFYTANQGLLSLAVTNLANTDSTFKALDTAMNNFGSTANVMMSGLNQLGQLHPFVGIAVAAFTLVIKLDLQRRENNKKVVAVQCQIQETMLVLFQLRTIKDPDDVGPDGQTIQGRMQTILEKIAGDIKTTANGCDHYLSKGLLAKMVKCKKYEKELASYMQLFTDNKKALEFALQCHTAAGVDDANRKLDTQALSLEKLNQKIEALFQTFDSPREREVKSFIDTKGGAVKCVQDDGLLEALVEKSGEPLSSVSGGRGKSKSVELQSAKRFLVREIQESLETALEKNMKKFEGKLNLMQQSLEKTVQSESDRVIDTLQAGAHSRIIDPDLRDIWKDMGWKGSSVKARHFILALHDHFVEKLGQSNSRNNTPAATPVTPLRTRFSPVDGVADSKTLSKWALRYINVSHVEPVMEAIDDDATGYVTVREVNRFVQSRPQDWSLPYWIAYWAVGWHSSITRYKAKIYSLVNRMFGMVPNILSANRRWANEYLLNHSIWRLELILRSTSSIKSSSNLDPELSRMSRVYSEIEEKRLQSNLEAIRYLVQSRMDVSLVTGSGSIEKYLFPLFYVILKRHLKIFLLACDHVLDPDEFESSSSVLMHILDVVDARMSNLDTVFRQTQLNVKARLANFAFGMFELTYSNPRRDPVHNSFNSWSEYGGTLDDDDDRVTFSGIDESILNFDLKDHIEFSALTHRLEEPEEISGAEGTWTGHLFSTHSRGTFSSQGLMQMTLQFIDGKINGEGETHSGIFAITGSVGLNTKSEMELSLTMRYPDGFTTHCMAKYDPENETIYGAWVLDDDERLAQAEERRSSTSSNRSSPLLQDSFSASDDVDRDLTRRRLEHVTELDEGPIPQGSASSKTTNILHLTRNPTWNQRFFSYAVQDYDESRARWAFARNSTLYSVRQRAWWWSFFKDRFHERKLFQRLTLKAKIWLRGFSIAPQDRMSEDDWEELAQLRRLVAPNDARFYSCLADLELDTLPCHVASCCEACGREIIRDRNICVQCTSDNLDDLLDLCMGCIDRPVSARGFHHLPSHVTVRTEQMLHDNLLAPTVRSARAIAERMKEYFSEIEKQDSVETSPISPSRIRHPKKKSSYDSESRILCACCGSVVGLPCWVCVVCTPIAVVCHDCGLHRKAALADGVASWHLPSHNLARLQDSSPLILGAHQLQAVAPGQHRIGDAARPEMESAVDQRLQTLETKVNDHLQALEERVDEHLLRLEESYGQRISGIEGKLTELISLLSKGVNNV